MPLTPDLTKFTTASPAIVSYDYVDFTTGMGYQSFYGGITINTTAAYVLLDSPVNTSYTSSYISANTNQDFYSGVFNVPRTVRGDCYVEGTLFINANDTTIITVTIYKYNSVGSVAISSATATSSQTSTVDSDRNFLLKVTLTETLFQAGDKIRINVAVSNDHGKCYVDSDKFLKFNIPFKIDL